MNKQELVSKIADHAKVTKTDAATMLESFIKLITTSLKKGQEVRLTGFGTFLTAKRKATTGRNPRTGELIPIEARQVVTFHASQKLKDLVQGD